MGLVRIDSGELPSAEGVAEGHDLATVVRKWQSIAHGRFRQDCRFLLQMIDETDRLRLWEKSCGGFRYKTRDEFLQRHVLIDYELTERDMSSIVLALRKGDEAAVSRLLSDRYAKTKHLGNTVVAVRDGPGRPSEAERDNHYNSENIMFSQPRQGTSAAYRTAKLRRDHPDIADRQARGEFKSVAAAERAARGEPAPVRKTPVYAHWDDPEDVAARIRAKMGEELVLQLKAIL